MTNVMFNKAKLYFNTLIPIYHTKERFMYDFTSLDELFNRYSQGDLSKKEFEELIFRFIIKNYQRFRLFDWNQDKCVDYLCWLYPRLSRAVETYKNTGASFDAYIGALVHWSAREYRTREAEHKITEYACWKAKAEEMAVHNPEPEYLEIRPPVKPFPNPRQVLILLLKSYFYVSEDFLSRAAPALGMGKEKLRQLVDELRKLRLRRDEEIRGLKERIFCQYYRCLAFEKKLELLPKDSVYYIRMQGRVLRARTRLTAMKARLASTRMEATNRQIAEVLGIPKGTVDSSLYSIKRKLIGTTGFPPRDNAPSCPGGNSGLL
jgi:DNA-binding CsgD family transcriptional regulator